MTPTRPHAAEESRPSGLASLDGTELDAAARLDRLERAVAQLALIVRRSHGNTMFTHAPDALALTEAWVAEKLDA